jgi:hypothetical protein
MVTKFSVADQISIGTVSSSVQLAKCRENCGALVIHTNVLRRIQAAEGHCADDTTDTRPGAHLLDSSIKQRVQGLT